MKITIHNDSSKLKALLMSANKWLRMIDNRRDEVSSTWFRHGADPKQLINQIREALKS